MKITLEQFEAMPRHDESWFILRKSMIEVKAEYNSLVLPRQATITIDVVDYHHSKYFFQETTTFCCRYFHNMAAMKRFLKTGKAEPEPKPELKLYVWENVLCGYTPGMMVALAPNIASARKMLRNLIQYDVESDLAKKPKIVTAARAFYVTSGG